MFPKAENPRLLLPPSATAHLSPKHPPHTTWSHRDPATPPCFCHLPLLPTPQTSRFFLRLPSCPSPSCLPSQSCTPELHPGSPVLQEGTLGTEAQVAKVVEGNSSEQPPKDKEEGPAAEVGLGAGKTLEEVAPQCPGSLQPRGSLPRCPTSQSLGDFQILCRKNCQILCVGKWGVWVLPEGEQGGREKCPTRTSPSQELLFPLLEERQILAAGSRGRPSWALYL